MSGSSWAHGGGALHPQARLPSLPELREAALRTADPRGFVLGTKASGSRLSGEWRGARHPPRAGLAGPAAACCPTAREPRLPIHSRGSASDKRIKAGRLQTWGGLQAAVRVWGGLGVPQGPWSCAGSSWPHGDLRATSRAGSEGTGGQRGKGPPEGTVGGRAVTDPGDPTLTRDVFRETLSVLKTPCPAASPRERKARGRQRGDIGGRRGRRVVSRGHVPP